MPANLPHPVVVLGPRVAGDHELDVDHVDEANLLQPLLVLFGLLHVPALAGGGGAHGGAPVVEGAGALVAAVAGAQDNVEYLDVSAWAEGGVGFAQDGLRVVEAAYYVAEVDVVQGMGVLPLFLLDVLPDEGDVGGGGGWLHGEEVGADDVGLGVVFGLKGRFLSVRFLKRGCCWGSRTVFEGPYACACGDVEDVFGGLDGGEAESAVEEELAHLVLEVCEG